MNEQTRTHLFNFSALFILGGVVIFALHWWIAPYLFAVGAVGMALCQMTRPVKELSIRQRRLQRFNVMASILMVAASTLMFNNRNEWIACMTVAAVFMTYSAFASDSADKG